MNIVFRSCCALPFAIMGLALTALAQSAPASAGQTAQSQSTSLASVAGAVAPAAISLEAQQITEPSKPSSWFARVDKVQKSQPNWITPLATVTPKLEEEVRYDQLWQNLGNGAHVDSCGGGKGLELIPTKSNEVILNIPPYEDRYDHKPASGWGDDNFLIIKQRLMSENNANGDYVVTAFLGFQAPTGDDAFSSHAWVITPTIAGGKGWGRVDVQGTFGVGIPANNEGVVGYAYATNIAFQYNTGKLWPEFEVNDTYWAGGERSGKNQVLLTPGVVVGRFKLYDRMKGIFGVGYQWAVAPALVKEPAITPTYDNAWIATVRVAF